MVQGGRAVGAPLPHAHLQPGSRPSRAGASSDFAPVGKQALDEAEADACNDPGLDDAARARAKKAAESLARRERDLDKLNDLALNGFKGPDYEMFASELAAYAYPVIASWIRRGLIYRYCADRGRPVAVTDADRKELAESHDDRIELAMETTAKALVFFRDQVLLGKRWNVNAGATVTTYFVGACLLAFPNVFRRWQGERRRLAGAYALEKINCPEGRGLGDYDGAGPEDEVVTRVMVIREVRSLPPRLREVAAVVLADDSTLAAAAESVGMTPRAVEGQFYRYRQSKNGALANSAEKVRS